jgi:hypothetical protein
MNGLGRLHIGAIGARREELGTEALEVALNTPEGRLTEREGVVKERFAGFEYPEFEVLKINDESFFRQRLSFKANLKLPGVAVYIDARTQVSMDVMGEVDVDALSNPVHSLALAGRGH